MMFVMEKMRYSQKAEMFKKIVYEANNLPVLRWRDREELAGYFAKYGGRIKEDRRRKKGHLVSLLQDKLTFNGVINSRIVAEVPMDFAMKVFVLGELPP
jgi:hypothetical protein